MSKKLLLFSLLVPIISIGQTAYQNEINAKLAAAQIVAPNTNFTINSILDCDAVSAPWSEDFNSAVVPAIPACATIENAGLGNNWETATNPGYGFTTKVLRYKWHVDNPANAWYFTPGINMTAGQTYAVSYKYGSAGANIYTEKLKVHVGTSAVSTAMSAAPIADHPLINNNVTPITNIVNFTPTADGVYTFGFNAYSLTDMFYLFVDDISITPSLAVLENSAVKVSLSPNPATNTVSITASSEIESVTLYNIAGQMVMKKNINASEGVLEVQQLQPGTYFAQVVSGENMTTVKILKN